MQICCSFTLLKHVRNRLTAVLPILCQCLVLTESTVKSETARSLFSTKEADNCLLVLQKHFENPYKTYQFMIGQSHLLYQGQGQCRRNMALWVIQASYSSEREQKFQIKSGLKIHKEENWRIPLYIGYATLGISTIHQLVHQNINTMPTIFNQLRRSWVMRTISH